MVGKIRKIWWCNENNLYDRYRKKENIRTSVNVTWLYFKKKNAFNEKEEWKCFGIYSNKYEYEYEKIDGKKKVGRKFNATKNEKFKRISGKKIKWSCKRLNQ